MFESVLERLNSPPSILTSVLLFGVYLSPALIVGGLLLAIKVIAGS